MKLTTARAMKLFTTAGDAPVPVERHVREAVRRDMAGVVNATSDRAAARTIYWWGCWDRNCTAIAYARRVRMSWAAMRGAL